MRALKDTLHCITIIDDHSGLVLHISMRKQCRDQSQPHKGYIYRLVKNVWVAMLLHANNQGNHANMWSNPELSSVELIPRKMRWQIEVAVFTTYSQNQTVPQSCQNYPLRTVQTFCISQSCIDLPSINQDMYLSFSTLHAYIYIIIHNTNTIYI